MPDRFALRLALGSSVIVTSYYTLDAMLAALLFEDCHDVEVAHEQIPLARTAGVWHGSQAFLEMNPEPHNGTTVFTASLRASHDVPVETVLPRRDGKIPLVGTGRRREWGIIQHSYPTMDAAALWWFGEGDTAAVEALIDRVRGVGKKFASGFGRVTDFEIAPASVDGVVDPEGLPMRPVPLGNWKSQPTVILADCAWRPAYWNPLNRAICAVPAEQQVARSQLEGWL